MPGSSTEELERELIKYLVKYGDQSFDYKEGKETVQLNVADVIIGDLENNGIRLTNSAYRTIYDEYKQLWEAGEQIEMHRFINHADPTVATAIVDLLTYDDNYTASKLWQKHDIIVESEQDRLPVAVPRVVILYKSKVIETIIAELQHKLCNEELSEEELGTVTHQISALNQERILIAKKLSRLIL
jgi:DNA primase